MLSHIKLEKYPNLELQEQRKKAENLCLGWVGILEDFWEEVTFELHLEEQK